MLTNLATRDRRLAAEGENLLAEIEIDQGHPAAAESALRRSLALTDSARAHLLSARLALSRGDLSAARNELERSRKLDPSDPDLTEIEGALPQPR